MPAAEKNETLKHVALLGGSFDPAHAGHLAISLLAMDQLGVDETWWLVAPYNPLKPKPKFSSQERTAIANSVAQDVRIQVVDLTKLSHSVRTIQTVEKLQNAYPELQFTWLMGADSFATLHTWQRWQDISKLLPFVVLARPGYNEAALTSPAAQQLTRLNYRQTKSNAGIPPAILEKLWTNQPPCWLFINREVANISSTEIR